MQRMLLSVCIAFILALPASLAAQSTGSRDYFHMPINISLYQNRSRDYSLGRMLGGGRPVINYIGLNIIRGQTAQLRGIEIGGFGNIQKERMTGIQLAGGANVVGGPGTGIQLAGFANIVEGDFSFMQGSILANIVDGSFLGIQGTGIANVVDGDGNGVQIAGIANVVDGGGHMLQLGGIANVVGESGTGAQSSLVANVVDGAYTGLQFTGIANVIGSHGRGAQAAGIANVVDGSYNGLQVSGLANVVSGHAYAIQAAGLANVIDGDARGMQLAGLANVMNGNAHSIQAAGLANVVNGNRTGAQAAGLANVSNGNMLGLQGAGLVNVTNGRSRGIQIAGLANVANTPDMLLQVGPINAADGEKVLPIGLYSVVSNNPTYTDYWVTEAGFIKTGTRSGSSWFHNMTITGIQIGNPLRWSIGWGLGLHRQINERFTLDLDGSIEHVNEDEFWTSDRNVLGIVKLVGGWQITDRIAIICGPTFNYLVSELNDGDDLAPWSMSDDFSGGEWSRSWIGFEAGLRYTREFNDLPFDIFNDFMSGFDI